MTEETLHIYIIDTVDYYVARSEDDAWTLWAEQSGERRDDYPDATCKAIPDDRRFFIAHDEVTRDGKWQTAAEWCMENGRGFLCSTEYRWP